MQLDQQLLKAENIELRAANNVLEIKNAELNHRVDNLNVKYGKLYGERDELSATLNEREMLIGTLYGEIHKLQRTDNQSTEIKRLIALCDANDIENTKLREKLSGCNSALAIKSKHNSWLKTVNDGLRAAYDERCAMYDALRTKLGAAREEIRNLNEEINENNNMVINVVITKKPRISLDAR